MPTSQQRLSMKSGKGPAMQQIEIPVHNLFDYLQSDDIPSSSTALLPKNSSKLVHSPIITVHEIPEQDRVIIEDVNESSIS